MPHAYVFTITKGTYLTNVYEVVKELPKGIAVSIPADLFTPSLITGGKPQMVTPFEIFFIFFYSPSAAFLIDFNARPIAFVTELLLL